MVVIANHLLGSIPAERLCFRHGQVERGVVGLRQRLEEVLPSKPPELVSQGCLSLSVRHHALCGWAKATASCWVGGWRRISNRRNGSDWWRASPGWSGCTIRSTSGKRR